MAKNIFQDVIPPEKRSIRNIPISVSRGRRISAKASPKSGFKKSEISIEPEEREEREERIAIPRKRRNFSRLFVWIIALGCVAGLVMVVSSVFTEAILKVIPKASTVAIDITSKAVINSTDGGLQFSNIKYDLVSKKTVVSSGEKKVNQKATGKIIIYNTTASTQKLIATTRFETPAGLIYRLQKAVYVPATKTVDGKKTAGSVEADVVADQAGDKYNIDLTDFTLPAYKNDPRFSAVYGRSETTMSGGFSGMKKIVSDADAKVAKDAIEKDLKTKLIQGVYSQMPAGYVFYESGSSFNFENLPDETGGDSNSVVLSEKGTINAVMFDKESLSKEIVKSSLRNQANENILVENLKDLEFALKDSDKLSEDTKEINFSLKGNAKLVWQFDGVSLKKDLSGKSKSDLNGVLSNYPGIYKAEAVIKPFWKFNFPSDTEKIKVDIVSEI